MSEKNEKKQTAQEDSFIHRTKQSKEQSRRVDNNMAEQFEPTSSKKKTIYRQDCLPEEVVYLQDLFLNCIKWLMGLRTRSY